MGQIHTRYTTLIKMPSLPSPETTMTLAGVGMCNYGAQMLLAPEFANDFYYKKGAVEASPKWQAWMGQALVGHGVTMLMSRKVATKQQMQGAAVACVARCRSWPCKRTISS